MNKENFSKTQRKNFLVHCCATNKTLWVSFKRFNLANPVISFCNQPIRLELARSRKSFPVFQWPVLKLLHSVFVCISSHTGASHTSLSCESVRESLPLKDSFSTGQHLCYSNDCFPQVLQCQRARQHYHYRLIQLLFQLWGLDSNVCLHLITKGRWDLLSDTHQRWSGFSVHVIRDYQHVT